MPIFTRRRIQLMLNELNTILDSDEKRRDLVKRLSSKYPEQALGAESELVVLWALSRIGDIEVEPLWPGEKKLPDCFSDLLFKDHSGEIVEITAISDGRISGEDLMRSATTKVCIAANQIKKGFGKYLYFNFLEKSGTKDGRYFRDRCVTEKFIVTDIIIDQLERWIKPDTPLDGSKIRIKNDEIDVIISKTKHKNHHLFNFHCSMPPEAHSLTENPLYETLKRKRSQLKRPYIGIEHKERRVIFLVDAGSTLLRGLGKFRYSVHTVTGDDIIRKFMGDHPDLDLICVMSSQGSNYRTEKLHWKLSLFPNENSARHIDKNFLDLFAKTLPEPKFEGYQARHLQTQNAFHHQARGWYKPTTYKWAKKGDCSVEFSSRMLLELLAGRISYEDFQKAIQPKFFENILAKGHTIQGVSFLSGGIDSDDDKIVFHYKEDPSASPYKMDEDVNGKSTENSVS